MTGFELDLTHFNEYRDTRTIDPNLFYNPATGYNQNPAAVGGVAEPAQYRLHADCVLRQQPAAAIRRRCRWRSIAASRTTSRAA